jgi:formylglycine-generating enzyme required for sulfatase activity
MRQFLVFVVVTGFDLDAFHGFGDLPSQTLRCVDWYAARDHCRWLNEQLSTASNFDGQLLATLVREQGWEVSLQSELEWEVAARGGLRALPYSWEGGFDPERANCRVQPSMTRRS